MRHAVSIIALLLSVNYAAADAVDFNPQMGEKWDRAAAADSPTSRIVFKLTMPMIDSYGTATYLGYFNDMDLFITAKHVPDLLGCEALFIESESLQTNYKLKCAAVIFSQANLDTAIVAASVEDSGLKARLHALPAARLAKAPFDLRTPLEILGFGSFHNDDQVLTSQRDDTCVSLSPYLPRAIQDPDQTNHPLATPVWSLPTGCDASPGDSGSSVFLRDQNRIAGILWTGGAHGFDLSNIDLIHVFEKSPGRLWSDFSYIVPAPVILAEIQRALTDSQSALTPAARKALSELLAAQ